jgi:hypothetical protein
MQQNPLPQPPEQSAWRAGPYQSQVHFSASPPKPSDSRSVQRVALKYGLIFGLIIVVRLALGTAIITAFSQALPQLVASYSQKPSDFALVSNIITAIYTLIDWVIYFLAGLFAARRVPQVRTAIFTSLWVDLCYGLVFCVIIGINLFLLSVTLSQYRAIPMGAYVSGIIVQAGTSLLLLHIVLGTAIGALGGLVGARSASRRNSSM